MTKGTLLSVLKEITYLRSIIKCYGGSLEQGRYHLFDNFRSMCLVGSKDKAAIYFDREKSTPKKVSIVKKLNKLGYYKNSNKKTTAEYEAFYSANNFDRIREVKLFSFKRGKILTLCTSQNEAEKQLSQYNTFSSAYNMPKVAGKDRYPNSFEISMIDIKPLPNDLEALSTILDCTEKYNPSIDGLERKSAKELIDFSYENQEMNSLLKLIADKINPNVLEYEIPLCMQHGDISKDNLIYGEADGKTGFWWIDWEHVDKRTFFYDFFFYIINSAMYFDTKSLDCYMNGDADNVLQKTFSHFGLEFTPESRKDWLLVFMIEFLKERVCDFGRVEALKKYCEFVEEHFGEIK